MVPFNLNLRSDATNHVTIGDLTGSTKLLVPGRATAATSIPQGAITSPIEPELLRGHSDVVQVTIGFVFCSWICNSLKWKFQHNSKNSESYKIVF